jgi:hypothetical protein
MIHKAISKTEVAFRYYKERNYHILYGPLKEYDRETACKIFCEQEKKGNIDKKLVKSIILSIFKEQKEMLKD